MLPTIIIVTVLMCIFFAWAMTLYEENKRLAAVHSQLLASYNQLFLQDQDRLAAVQRHCTIIHQQARKLDALTQPWAMAAVCGHMPVINAPKPPGYSGALLIHAAGKVQGDAANIGAGLPGFEIQQALIGVVVLDYACDPEGTDLPGAAGPSCWVISPRCVFDQPIAHPDKARGLREAPIDLDWDAIIAKALRPRDWLEREWARHVPVKAEDVHQPRPDGWTGD